MTNEVLVATRPAIQQKLKAGLKKPFIIRDLVKAQIRVDNQSNTFGTKKRKLTDDSDRCVLRYY